jgi:DNA-directed RNA polymerase specialized sigma24 family protein
MIQLDATPLDTTDLELAYNQAREILIAQAISVLWNARRNEEENGHILPTLMGELPDLPRLAFVLRFVVRSSEAEVASFLDVTPFKVRELVKNAIDLLSVDGPFSG